MLVQYVFNICSMPSSMPSSMPFSILVLFLSNSVFHVSSFYRCIECSDLSCLHGFVIVSGGTGVTFDWNVARALGERGYPLIVAGGLNPLNVHEAVKATKAWCVDVSSGVEDGETGFKDLAKVSAFIANAKRG